MAARTYFETMLPLWVWIVAGVCSLTLSLLGFVWFRYPVLLFTFAVLGLAIAVTPLIMRYIYSILISWFPLLPTFLRNGSRAAMNSEEWADERMQRLSAQRFPRHLGIGCSLVAVVTFWAAGAFRTLNTGMVILGVLTLMMAGFTGGIGLAAVYYLGHFVWDLGGLYSVRISEHAYGVLSVGRTLVKCYALVAIAWCCYTGSATLKLGQRWIPLAAMAAPAFVFLVVSFVVCQLPLHARMMECKRCRLLELDNIVDKLTSGTPAEVSENHQHKVNFFLSEIKRVNQWPEWPFSVANLSGVVAASMGAIAPQLIPMFTMVKSLVRHVGH